MKYSEHIESIPISEIRVVNPRARNKVTFQNIVANIRHVGLKKPIISPFADVSPTQTEPAMTLYVDRAASKLSPRWAKR